MYFRMHCLKFTPVNLRAFVRAQSEYVAETLDDKEDIEPSSLVPIEPMVALFQ